MDKQARLYRNGRPDLITTEAHAMRICAQYAGYTYKVVWEPKIVEDEDE